MQPPLPAPTAQGSFAKTPLPHLLVYALERSLTGSFELHTGSDSAATMLVVQGMPAKLRTTEGIHHLGEVMVELGMITVDQSNASLALMRESPRLQGQLLKELGAASDEAIEAGVRAQLKRKVEHLFTLSPETTYAYYDGADMLAGYGGPPTPIDPLPVLWRGVKHAPSWEHVDATLRRVGGMAVRLTPTAQIERLELTRPELQAVEVIRERPARVVDIVSAKLIGPSITQQLVYFLVITKQVELVEPGSVRPPPSSAPNPNQTGRQAFARVQLQARPVARGPVVVEEMAASPADDERASIPGIVAPGTDSAESADGIGALITQTIASSLPPRPLTAIEPAPLTAEQNALKTKIIERAEQITAQNYFQMLGVTPESSPELVQKAFIALAKVWHPDRLPTALDDVKDACSKVFSHLTEAHATLSDPERRQEYMTLIRDGGATPDDQSKIQTILEAATEFQKAEILMKRNPADPQVFDLVRRALSLDPEQVEYMALFTWLEAHLPQWQSKEKTQEKIRVLDRCIEKNPRCERAYFYRAMLHKRNDDGRKAIHDFKIVAELNPRNLDAAREVRLYRMRGGSKAPPPPSTTPSGGLFGKLFKK